MATDPGVSGAGWSADPVSSGDPTSGGFGGTLGGGGWGDTGVEVESNQKSSWGATVVSAIVGILTALATGSVVAGVAMARLTKKIGNTEYAQKLVDMVESGEAKPRDVGDIAAADIKNGIVTVKPMTEKEAIDTWLDANGYAGDSNEARWSKAKTIKDYVKNADSRAYFDNPGIQQIATQIKAAQDPETYKNGGTLTLGEQETGPLKKPTPTTPAEVPALPPTDIEKEISSLQLATAREFRNKINDPRILEDIYKSLPATKMSTEDRAKFTEEYADIKKRVTAVGMEQQNKAMGQKLDDLVSRGVISQESADKQRMKNEAAVNTVIKIYNKKLDSARIGIAKEQFKSDSGLKMYGAGVIADVDNRNRQIYSNVVSQALNNLERKRSAQYTYASDAANASLRNKAIRSETDIDIGNSLAETLAPMAGKALRNAT